MGSLAYPIVTLAGLAAILLLLATGAGSNAQHIRTFINALNDELQ
jgi:hypothetical protein